MWLTLIAQIEVIDTVVTVNIDSGTVVPPVYSVWIKVKNNYNYPVTLSASPQYLPFGEYIGDTLVSSPTTTSISGCINIPWNYKIKNENFNRISVCTHGFTVFLRANDSDPSNVPNGYLNYNYYLNFLDNGSNTQLDSTKISVYSNEISISGFRNIYASRGVIKFKGNLVKSISLELDIGDVGTSTAMLMFGRELSKIGDSLLYWDDAVLLCQLFNFDFGCTYSVYSLTEAIDTIIEVVNIPAGGIDSMLVTINLLQLKQEMPSHTARFTYRGGYFVYKTDDPNNPVGHFKVIVKGSEYTVSTSESKRDVSNIPFKYQNGYIVLTEKGNYRIYSVDGNLLGAINSSGKFELRHLRPGIYIIKYNNQSFKAIVR